ncbi:alpha-ketoglutarate-dependent dioxygenase AlkB family protein [Gilvimarinus sp. 1_MG-2023]|uniref:alpha-ketoglutarate-dependent dioxygenase AlkB family protein n=1 Tax=Gilvimarinus sp. 1_MG-2023 TaxID=3062638 RepID=UPI0026E480C7|nr:alpha-ketoglutarate-dependent dioxygenase AlkB [Gilvimarinus sp. 1_MG-2023]MDO6746140.1 alpha-ketoglutarate-dependent dioxygenase AlkB [Gilvimarinus sp. 1_MG-2023]
MQRDLFARSGPEVLVEHDGWATLHRQWLPEVQAERLLSIFSDELVWQQTVLRMYGKSMPIPRLNAWYGEPSAHYRYSGASFTPKPWTAELHTLRCQLEDFCECEFNSVLANLYRDGRDSVAWHSDDEPELGPEPTIASLSLGQTRHFTLRHKTSRHTCRVALASGDLLLMGGAYNIIGNTNWSNLSDY